MYKAKTPSKKKAVYSKLTPPCCHKGVISYINITKNLFFSDFFYIFAKIRIFIVELKILRYGKEK
jgi:hypothetical protein